MTLIDQRILIVASAETVWAHLTAPTTMTKWSRFATQISVLSTHPTGVGARWRSVDAQGRTSIQEITAWVDNIGYEYVMVDGPYREFKGRLRLQADSKGTIVNWWLDYSLRGLFPGLQNVLTRRRIQTQMVESLRELDRLVRRSGAKFDPERQAKYAMREAPDVDQRASLRVMPDGPRAERIAIPGAGIKPVASAAPPKANFPVLIDDDDQMTVQTHAVAPQGSGQASALEPASQDGSKQDGIKPAFASNKLSTETSARVSPTEPSPQGAPSIVHAFAAPKPEPISFPPSITPVQIAEAAKFPVPMTVEDGNRNSPPTINQPAANQPATVGPMIVEPPLVEGDTRPRKAVAAPVINEPPLDPEDTPRSHSAMTVPIAMVAPPAVPPPALPILEVTQTMDLVSITSEPVSDGLASSSFSAKASTTEATKRDTQETGSTPAKPVPAMHAEPPTSAQTSAAGSDALIIPAPFSQPSSLPEIIPTPPSIIREALSPIESLAGEPLRPPPTQFGDTGEISIWEVFGMDSPSRQAQAHLDAVVEEYRTTSQMKAITPEQIANQIPNQISAARTPLRITDPDLSTGEQLAVNVVPSVGKDKVARTESAALPNRRVAVRVRALQFTPRLKSRPNARRRN